MQTANTNWSGNIHYQATQTHHPRSLDAIQALVQQAAQVKVVGSRHSFNTIADTTAEHIALDQFNQVVALDPDAKTVTIEGGMTYGQLAPYLHERGFALPNLASLPHISVAGAIATGTHGSGETNQALASVVRSVDIVTGAGQVQTVSRDAHPDIFSGVVVGLGALGVVAHLTLEIEPSYAMAQHIYLDLPFTDVLAHFDAIQTQAYSVSLFTDWTGDYIKQVWLKSRVGQGLDHLGESVFGARLADRKIHPIPATDPRHCTDQLGTIGAWHERLPHFKLEFTPSSGAELQSEYLVPRQHALAALQALKGIQETLAQPLLVSEIRTIAGDDLWLSPFYEQDSVAFHFTWRQDWPAVQTALAAIETALEPFQPRPHWGKLFLMSAETVSERYPKLDAFRQLCQRFDPERCFSNAFLEQYLYADVRDRG